MPRFPYVCLVIVADELLGLLCCADVRDYCVVIRYYDAHHALLAGRLACRGRCNKPFAEPGVYCLANYFPPPGVSATYVISKIVPCI